MIEHRRDGADEAELDQPAGVRASQDSEAAHGGRPYDPAASPRYAPSCATRRAQAVADGQYVGEPADRHPAARPGGVDHPPAAEGDAGVRDRPARAGGALRPEEHEVAGGGPRPRPRARRAAPRPSRRRSGPAGRLPRLIWLGPGAALERPPHQAGAVEAAVRLRAPRGADARPVAGPHVGLADLPQRRLHHRQALRAHGRQAHVAVAGEARRLPRATRPARGRPCTRGRPGAAARPFARSRPSWEEGWL